MRSLFICLIIPFSLIAKPKLLHVSFHQSALYEFAFLRDALDVDITNFNLLETPCEEFDGITPARDSSRYQLTKERANAIWNNNKDFFSSFDGYIVSDTTPLSRIFMQNAPNKPLLLWICNRFDFSISDDDLDTYGNELKAHKERGLLVTVAYTPYEIYHMQNTIGLTPDYLIKPSGHIAKDFIHYTNTSIPQTIDKTTTFYIGRYRNMRYMRVPKALAELKIPYYFGPYNGPNDLKEFKGIIHIPYTMSTFTLFENWQLGLIQFIPSQELFQEWYSQSPHIFLTHTNRNDINEILTYAEFYLPENQSLFVTFDSFKDLHNKISSIDYISYKARIEAHAKNHLTTTLNQWKEVLEEFTRL